MSINSVGIRNSSLLPPFRITDLFLMHIYIRFNFAEKTSKNSHSRKKLEGLMVLSENHIKCCSFFFFKKEPELLW